MEVGDHLFRREAGRMVAALTRVFGVHNLALAEDVVQDAFCRAPEVWKFRGVPENPSAWLMAAAKNRAWMCFAASGQQGGLPPELARVLDSQWTLATTIEELFEPSAIRDDQLRMMFSCCQPRLSEEAQVALVLHILCGFGVGEVAAAFMCGRTAIEKRISRGKKVLAGSSRLFEIGEAHEFASRLTAVQRAVYLLFNEGYHGASPVAAVRGELCEEAMRLGALLREHQATSTPGTIALSALMCLHAARLPGRVDDAGNLNALFDQDRSRWDAGLIEEGQRLLNLSATGDDVNEYHVEAAIASVHATAKHADDTDWELIVGLYDRLLVIRPSPVVALNRAIAVAQREGPERGLEEVRAIEGGDRLTGYPFYPATLGELEMRCGRFEQAREHFAAAVTLARNPMEQGFLKRRFEACRAP